MLFCRIVLDSNYRKVGLILPLNMADILQVYYIKINAKKLGLVFCSQTNLQTHLHLTSNIYRHMVMTPEGQVTPHVNVPHMIVNTAVTFGWKCSWYS